MRLRQSTFTDEIIHMNKVGGPVYLSGELTKAQKNDVKKAVEAGELIRLFPGIYIKTAEFSSRSAIEQLHLKMAVIAQCRDMPLVGLSAARLLGYPVDRQYLSTHIELGRRFNSGTTSRLVKYRNLGNCPPEHLLLTKVHDAEIKLTKRARTCIDVTRWYGLEQGLIMMDYGLNKGHFTKQALRECLEEMGSIKGINDIRKAINLATPWSESPRESLVKLALFNAGLPAPLQQVNIYDNHGNFLGRVDFFYPEISAALEYDGQGKWNGEFGMDSAFAIRKEFDRHISLSKQNLLIYRIDTYDFMQGDAISEFAALYRSHIQNPRKFPAEQMRAMGSAW